jgi:LysM repeat protein
MQRIERYGVIALVFLLVTILAVSLWGESKGDGWFSKLTGGTKTPENTAAADRLARRNANRAAQLSATGGEQTAGAQNGAAPLDPAATGAAAAPANQTAQGAAPSMLTPGQIGGAPATPPLGTAQTTPLVAGGPQPAATPVNRGLNDRPLVNPALQTAPVQPATREYKVKSGDTLGGIAQHELGSSKRVADIQKLNNNIDPTKLMPGMTLVLPPSDAKTAAATGAQAPASAATNLVASNTKTIEPKTTSQAKASVAGARKYTVRSGDTLSVIASRELGSAKRWTEIRDLNPGVDERSLKVSAVLNLPAGSAAPSTSAPTSTAGGDKTERVASLDPMAGRKSRVQ